MKPSAGMIRTLVLVAGLAGLAGCGKEEPPVTAAKAYAAAAQRGDSEALLGLVDSRAREYLEASAERASDQIGGRRNVEPHEMLQVIDVDPRFQVARAELTSSTEATATVTLTGSDGTLYPIELVYEGEQWRVRVPVPPEPSGVP